MLSTTLLMAASMVVGQAENTSDEEFTTMASEFTRLASKFEFATVELRAICFFDSAGRMEKTTLLGGTPLPITACPLDGVIYFYRPGYRQLYKLDRVKRTMKRISTSREFVSRHLTLLPGPRFAILNNAKDEVAVFGEDYNLIKTAKLSDSPDNHLQNTHGIVVGNDLVVSEDGHHRIVKMDLKTYEVSVLRELPKLRPWLGAIAYQNNTYYVCTNSSIFSFHDDKGDVKHVADIDGRNITGMSVVGDFAYVVTNATGAVFKVDLDSGSSRMIVEGLIRPKGLLRIPDLP